MAIDDDGCIWSTWNARSHNLFKYDPELLYHHWVNKLDDRMEYAALESFEDDELRAMIQ